ncbi:MAG: hypothetical protein ACJAXV_000222 [Bacteroidia bacterium]|jgi:hypothetical protein|tara:strand:- start:194 stop:793 length:600 start_codon:yes stop_codon:yes gene_type:complete
MTTKLIILGVCLGSFTSCGNKLDFKSYFDFYNQFQEGSYMEVLDNGYIYQLQYRPKEYLSINELKTNPKINSSLIRKEMNEYAEGLNFCLRIASEKHEDVLEKNTSAKSEYYERIGKLNADFPYNVAGVNETDTMLCQFHHYERTYKVQPFVQVLFSLNGDMQTMPDKVIFDDIIFNGGKRIEFTEIIKYLNQLPKLNI